jgi:monoamine oxidase
MLTLDYCRELGVPIEVFTNTNAGALIYNETTGMKAPVQHLTAKADVYGFIAKERLLTFLKSYGSLGSDYRYTGTEHRGFSIDVGRYFSFEFGYDQAMLMLQPVGGMDRIPMAFARAIGEEKIRTGAAVLRLQDRPGVPKPVGGNGTSRSSAGSPRPTSISTTSGTPPTATWPSAA